MFFVAGSAFAKPGADEDGPYLGNGFPSGPHFNLNIHGKDPSVFIECPDVNNNGGLGYDALWKWDGANWVLDTSIFTPEYSDPGTERILVQSGKTKGNKKNGTVVIGDQLVVTDPCTEGIDGTSAVFRLPPCEAGYRVYGRALGTPTKDGSPDRMITLSPGTILTAEDEHGNNLLELGTITGNSYTKTNGTQFFVRGKGQPVTIPLTDLFTFDGTLCYFTDPLVDGTTTTEEILCCLEVGTGTYTDCELDDVVDDTCPGDKVEVTAYCVDYEFSPQWIFNIADFVEYYFGVKNDGVKLLQIRFYPIDPGCITSS
jgi:hypothetical protein